MSRCAVRNPSVLEHAPAQLGAATGRRAKLALRRDIENAHRRRARAKLAELRAQLRAFRLQQRNAIAETVQKCRAERLVGERATGRVGR